MPLRDEEAVQVVLAGVSYQDWLEVEMDSDIFTPADAWSVSAALPGSDVRREFREGVKCDLYVGRDRQMSGVIDKVAFNGNRRETRMRISGRDRGAFLVDNEAKQIKAAQYTLKTLIQSLLDSSFGIKKLIDSNDANRKLVVGKADKKGITPGPARTLQTPVRVSTKIDPGQRISSIIDLHCKRLGITWWITAEGDLFIGKPDYKQSAAYSFQVAELGSSAALQNNVESWSVERDIGDRYSEVQVNGSSVADKKKLFVRYSVTSKDPDLVERGIVRKMIVPDYDTSTADEAQHRADMEQGQRRLSGLVINLTVPGFRQGDRLYAVDTLATVRIDEADINGTFYVTQRRFTESRGSRRTSLTLHEKGLWLP